MAVGELRKRLSVVIREDMPRRHRHEPEAVVVKALSRRSGTFESVFAFVTLGQLFGVLFDIPRYGHDDVVQDPADEALFHINNAGFDREGMPRRLFGDGTVVVIS